MSVQVSSPNSPTVTATVSSMTQHWVYDPLAPSSNCLFEFSEGPTYEPQRAVGKFPGVGRSKRVGVTDSTTYGMDISGTVRSVNATQFTKQLAQMEKTGTLLLQDPDGFQYYFKWEKTTIKRTWTGSFATPFREYTLTAFEVDAP